MSDYHNFYLKAGNK